MILQLPIFTHISILLISITLTACGGGGSPDSAVTQSNDPINAANAAILGNCFKWTPGVKYVKNDGYKTLMIEEQFEGQTAITDMELRPNDTRFGGVYIIVDANFVTVLGLNDYNGNGVYNGKDVYTNFRLPAEMAVGQTVQINYGITRTRMIPPSVTNGGQATQYKFEGFETVTLGGRTFTNVCKLRSPSLTAGQTSVEWVARGFGVIKQEDQDAAETTVPGTVRQLVTIVVAP